MYVEKLQLKNYRQLKNLEVAHFSEPKNESELIVLAGPNGSGKSTVLEIIGYSLVKSWDWSDEVFKNLPQEFDFSIFFNITSREKEEISKTTNFRIDHPYSMRVYRDNMEGGPHTVWQEGSVSTSVMASALKGQMLNPVPGFYLEPNRYYGTPSVDRVVLSAYAPKVERNTNNGWNTSFNKFAALYSAISEFLLRSMVDYIYKLGQYHKGEEEKISNNEKPTNPIEPYNNLLAQLFPSHRFVEPPDENYPNQLYIKLPTNEIIPFSNLSSGEKEAFFMLAFFLYHNITDSIIVIDEPELHLHPELARKFVKILKRVMPRNQIWLATHNAEIIDEAKPENRLFFERDKVTNQVTITSGENEEKSKQLIRSLYGYSGYVGISKSLVFLEGTDGSIDKAIWTRLAGKTTAEQIKFIPAESSTNITRLSPSIAEMLQNNISWTNIYLIRDRDFLDSEGIKKARKNFPGRVYVLERHEIENYLLGETLIAEVQSEFSGQKVDPTQVKSSLLKIALNMSAEVLFNMVSFRLQHFFQPEDFSGGTKKFMAGEAVFQAVNQPIMSKLTTMKSQITATISKIQHDLAIRVDLTSPNNIFTDCQDELHDALFGGNEDWKKLFPGKELLEEYARKECKGITPEYFANLLVNKLSESSYLIPPELQKVFDAIVTGTDLPI